MKIGIDIGGSHIGIGIVNENGKVIEKIEKRLMSKEKEDIEQSIENELVQAFKMFSEKYDIEMVGIAVPGTIDKENKMTSENLGVEEYPIIDMIKNEMPVKISLNNDAKCAAVAEKKYGCLKDYEDAIFLTLGTGIGGAAFYRNELLITKANSGFEFGHTIIEKNGIECTCGKKGCFERYSSMKALKDNLRDVLGLDENISGRELLELIKENEANNRQNKDIDKIVEEFIENLSIGISNIINIFEPEAIGIGGSFVYFEEVLLMRIKDKLINGNLLFNKRDNVIIKSAILGNDAGIIGATLM